MDEKYQYFSYEQNICDNKNLKLSFQGKIEMFTQRIYIQNNRFIQMP